VAQGQPTKGYGTNTGSSQNIFQQLEEEHRARTQKRETEVRGMYDQNIAQYQPGGGFGAGTEAMLGRQKQQYLGSAQQNLISSGLFGSTMGAGLGKKFEEEVGMPTRLKLEDLRYDRLADATRGKADFVTDIQDRIPSYAEIAQLSAQSAPSYSRTINSPSSGFGTTSTPMKRNDPAIEAERLARERAANDAARAEYRRRSL